MLNLRADLQAELGQVVAHRRGWADAYPDDQLGNVTFTWTRALQALTG